MNQPLQPTNTRCSRCGLLYEGEFWDHDDRCPELKRQAREYRSRLAEIFQLRLGPPVDSDSKRSLNEAEQRVQAKVKEVFRYPSENLFESESWWYIPYT